MNAISHITPALEGEAIDHAGIGETAALDDLIAASEASNAALLAAEERFENTWSGGHENAPPELQAADAEDRAAWRQVQAYRPTTLPEVDRKYAHLRAISPEGDFTETLEADLRALVGGGIDRAAWDTALAALAKAESDLDQLEREAEEASAKVDEAAPEPEALTVGGTVYDSEKSIEDARGLTFDQKVVMMAALREWLPRRQEAERFHGLRELRDEADERTTSGEELALVDTPAPTIGDLADKIAIVLSRALDVPRQDLDTADCLAEHLSGTDVWARDMVRIYQDAMRLTGRDAHLVAVQPFDALAMLEELEADPGHFFDETFGLMLYDPDNVLMGALGPKGGAFERWRNVPHWQKAAVKRAAKARQIRPFKLAQAREALPKELMQDWGDVDLAARLLQRDYQLTDEEHAIIKAEAADLAATAEITAQIVERRRQRVETVEGLSPCPTRPRINGSMTRPRPSRPNACSTPPATSPTRRRRRLWRERRAAISGSRSVWNAVLPGRRTGHDERPLHRFGTDGGLPVAAGVEPRAARGRAGGEFPFDDGQRPTGHVVGGGCSDHPACEGGMSKFALIGTNSGHAWGWPDAFFCGLLLVGISIFYVWTRD